MNNCKGYSIFKLHIKLVYLFIYNKDFISNIGSFFIMCLKSGHVTQSDQSNVLDLMWLVSLIRSTFLHGNSVRLGE